MGAIALLLIGTAMIPLEPRLLGCKYGEVLSEREMVLLGDWNAKPKRVWLCGDGPGRLNAYEGIEAVCERALLEVLDPTARCIPIPSDYRAPR